MQIQSMTQHCWHSFNGDHIEMIQGSSHVYMTEEEATAFGRQKPSIYGKINFFQIKMNFANLTVYT